MPSRDPNKVSPAELENWKQRVSSVLAYLTAEERLAKSLLDQYRRVLAER